MLTVYDRAPWQWSIMIQDNLLERKAGPQTADPCLWTITLPPCSLDVVTWT